MSGLPNPRSTTSAPARRASIFRPSLTPNTYGGRALIRRTGAPGAEPDGRLAWTDVGAVALRAGDRPGRRTGHLQRRVRGPARLRPRRMARPHVRRGARDDELPARPAGGHGPAVGALP